MGATEALTAMRLERIEALAKEITEARAWKNHWRGRIEAIPELPRFSGQREQDEWSRQIEICAAIADKHGARLDDLQRRYDALLAAKEQ